MHRNILQSILVMSVLEEEEDIVLPYGYSTLPSWFVYM